MDKLTQIHNRIRTNQNLMLRQKIRYEQNYIEALDDIQQASIKKRLEHLDKKHQSILHPLYESTLSNEAYVAIKIKRPLEKLFHKYHLYVLRQQHLFHKNKSEQPSMKEINKDLQDSIDQLEKKLVDSRVIIPNSENFYQQKKQELEQKKQKYLQHINAIFEIQKQKKLQKFKSKLNKHQQKLNQLIQKTPLSNYLNDDVVLEIQNLTMQFGGLKAVDDLSFQVKKNEIFGLIGPNGAGKTTVFNCITQFYKATSGNIYFENKYQEDINLNDYPVHQVIQEGIARTFQNVELVYELSVLNNLLVGAHSLIHTNMFKHMFHTPDVKRETYLLTQRAIKILIDLGLYAYKDAYPIGLPYGVLKKIELARVLMTHPKLIILDEPAAGLNDTETQELAKTIQTIRDQYQTTVFLVEHDMGLVMDICDRICAISFGKTIAIGTPKEIQNNKEVQRAYLGGDDDAQA